MALGDVETVPQGLLQTVEAYNRDDCLSALHLRDWLEALRRQLEADSGQLLPRPAPREGEPGEELPAHLADVREVMERLLAGVPDEESDRTLEDRARWLLAQMLEWHRREEKSSWWEYFRLCDLSEDELIEDRSALGGLVYGGQAGTVRKSIIHRYRFPPQEHAIDRATEVRDPRTQQSAVKVIDIDERDHYVYIKRGTLSQVPHPTALVPYQIVPSRVLRESLLRLGTWVAEHGIDGPVRFGRPGTYCSSGLRACAVPA